MLIRNLTGQKFSLLTVVRRLGANRWGNYQWECKCECGKTTHADGGNIVKGHTRSCGCLARSNNLRHGACLNRVNSPEYAIWRGIIARCTNPHVKAYKHYGGRGIKLCAGWWSFERFAADMGKRPPSLSIDRQNNDGHYSCGKCEECVHSGWPMNCLWATSKEQANNSRRTRIITVGTETKTLADWSRSSGIRRAIITNRLCIGWTPKRAVTQPMRKSSPRKIFTTL